MKIAVINSFFKFYVMTSTGIDSYGIVHVKVDFIPGLKMCVLPILGKFVWTTIFDNVYITYYIEFSTINSQPSEFRAKV